MDAPFSVGGPGGGRSNKGSGRRDKTERNKPQGLSQKSGEHQEYFGEGKGHFTFVIGLPKKRAPLQNFPRASGLDGD